MEADDDEYLYTLESLAILKEKKNVIFNFTLSSPTFKYYIYPYSRLKSLMMNTQDCS